MVGFKRTVVVMMALLFSVVLVLFLLVLVVLVLFLLWLLLMLDLFVTFVAGPALVATIARHLWPVQRYLVFAVSMMAVEISEIVILGEGLAHKNRSNCGYRLHFGET